MDQEPFEPSTVNDLETARLALRWALERLHKMTEEAAAHKEEKEKAVSANRRLAEEAAQKEATV